MSPHMHLAVHAPNHTHSRTQDTQDSHRRSSTLCLRRSSSRGASVLASVWLTKKGSLRVTAFKTCGRGGGRQAGKEIRMGGEQQTGALRQHAAEGAASPVCDAKVQGTE